MTTAVADPALTSPQASALFDILTHRETYAEIEAFKQPRAVHTYGPPFQSADTPSTSPILQSLITRFFLTLPGVRDFGPTFWSDRAEPLLSELAIANLSESFDKGDCGQRKTLATAISALLEYLARGKFGGLPKKPSGRTTDAYDLDNPNDLVAGFQDVLQGLVYGELLDDLVAKTAETSDLSDHTKMVQAAHRFILINVASFMHYTLIVSSKGPALLSLLENAHKLIPYGLMRQTLRVGNAATMIGGMVRIVLAKASVGAVTNWLGLSSGSDEGMNLMQTIISTVLGWENRGFKKRAAQIEKGKDAPSKDELEKLREYTKMPADEQERYRLECRQNTKTLVSSILESAPSDSRSDQHVAAEYLVLHLSIEDRDRLIHTLCRHNPDLTTPMVRAVVSAYDPVIRRVHQAVDLSTGLGDLENFINDLIALAKPKDGETAPANGPARIPVSSFVRLCEKHQGSSHRFLHQLAKNGGDLTTWYKAWVRTVTRQFRVPEGEPKPLQAMLDPLMQQLGASDRAAVMEEVDAHLAYLAQISSSSDERARALCEATETPDPSTPTRSKQSSRAGTPTGIRSVLGVRGPSSPAPTSAPTSTPAAAASRAGPGVFLAKWQALIDSTELAPFEDGVRWRAGEHHHDGPAKGVEHEARRAPSVNRTLELLLTPFRDKIREIGAAEDWRPT